jgi:hypothetical protein
MNFIGRRRRNILDVQLLASYSMFGLLKGSMSFGGTLFWRMVFEIFDHGLLLFWWLQE